MRRWIPALALGAAAALSQAQTPRLQVTKPDTAHPGPTTARSLGQRPATHPDPTVDQTLTDEHQPETATDDQRLTPETARDDQKLTPETARDDQKLTPETARDDQKLAPETARDDQKFTPETARDDQKLTPPTVRHDQRLVPESATDNRSMTPETASDAPRRSTTSRRAAATAAQGVRSNTPPTRKPLT